VSLANKLPILAIALVAIVGGLGTGLAASMVMAQGADSEEAAAADGARDEDAVPQIGVISLGEFVVNVKGSGGGRLLRMVLDVEAEQATLERCEARKPQVQDEIIALVSDWTYQDLEGLSGKTRLKKELVARINQTLKPQQIQHLYFTAFAVQ